MPVNIDLLTKDELIDLNTKIIERLRFLEMMKSHSEMLEFSLGDQVSFSAKDGKLKIGILVKYNKKTVTIITEDKERWNVSPKFVSKMKDVKEEASPLVIKGDTI